jgi:hypothetical protein
MGGSGARDDAALTEGADVGGGRPCAVLCRVHGAHAPWGSRASDADRAYAAEEATALLASWLASLRAPIVNAPSPAGLAGPAFTPAHWLGLAARSGLPCMRLRLTTNARSFHVDGWRALRHNATLRPSPAVPVGPRPACIVEPLTGPAEKVLIVGDRFHGPLPLDLHEAACRLARRAGCLLLELTLRSRGDEKVVAAVDPVPPLMGSRAAQSVADLMERLAGSSTIG